MTTDDITTTVTETPTAPYALTALDIKKLRTCDQVVFRYSRETKAYGRKGLSQIEAYKEADKTNPWEQRHVIPTESSCRSYEEGQRIGRAFALLYRWKWSSGPLHTVLDLLRPGDILTMVWEAGADSDYLRNAGLHQDRLSLNILRGKKQMLFLLEASVCPSNSARTCQCEQGSDYDRD